MRLRREVVNLVWLDLLHDVNQGSGISHIAVVQDEMASSYMGILVDTVNSSRIEERRAAFDAMHFVSLIQRKRGEIRSVLPGDACDQCPLQTSVSSKSRVQRCSL